MKRAAHDRPPAREHEPGRRLLGRVAAEPVLERVRLRERRRHGVACGRVEQLLQQHDVSTLEARRDGRAELRLGAPRTLFSCRFGGK